MANSVEAWDRIWRGEGRESWRGTALEPVYQRISQLLRPEVYGLDIGGGVGLLSSYLRKERKAEVVVLDHSAEACRIAQDHGCEALERDVDRAPQLIHEGVPDPLYSSKGPRFRKPEVVFATEVLEHLEETVRAPILRAVNDAKVAAFFSVPNNRLGPEEEPQHTIKWCAKSFLDYLRGFFGDHVRVEAFKYFLLAVVNPDVKPFKLSVCFPARNEAADIERTLASFRGVADQLVVGIDPRTTDNTRELAEFYADLVFTLEDPAKAGEDGVPEKGVHFAWIRNQCMDRCTGDWIFMTEAHEELKEGQDVLLHLDQIPEKARIGMVLRTGQNQQWGFPWLCRNAPDLRYTRSTHNILDYPAGTFVMHLPQVKTLHFRDHKASVARKEQRKVQNRLTLMDDWIKNKNVASLHYLGAEWREFNPEKSIERLEEFLAQPSRNGPMRYHTRLILAKQYAVVKKLDEARRVLMGATADDWARVEHWVYLGDLCFHQERFEEAIQYYRYAATMDGHAPFTLWWIDLSVYRELPAQRLAMTYGQLGMLEQSLFWAEQALSLLPEDAPEEAFSEAKGNIALLREGLGLPVEEEA